MTVEQARTTELLWGSRQQPRRELRPSLSLERIVEAAMAIADAEGLATLSMQRIAGELGYTKMSLYRYTPGKAELTALMLDTALGDPPDLAEVPGGWRPRLRAWAMRMWEVTRRRPWTLELAVGARVLGPNELGWLEAGLAALAGTGLTGAERLDTIALLSGHVRSLVQQTTASGTATDTTEQELAALLGGILAEHGDSYPEVRAAFAEASAPSAQDDALDFGLTRILDGLAVLITQRRRDAPARTDTESRTW
jgi:AcrR family transcriptional regulator